MPSAPSGPATTQTLEIPPTPRTTPETTQLAPPPQSPPQLLLFAQRSGIHRTPLPPMPTPTIPPPASSSTSRICSLFVSLLHRLGHSIRQLHQVIPVFLTQLPLYLRLHFFPNRLRA